MANFRSSPPGNNDWPYTAENKVIDKDPMIIKVPMDEVEWGSRKSQMAKVRAQGGFKEAPLSIKHVEGKKGV